MGYPRMYDTVLSRLLKMVHGAGMYGYEMEHVSKMSRDQFAYFLQGCEVADDSRSGATPSGDHPYALELDDLYFLYCSVRDTAAISVLEFGSGWSTLALALALHENKASMLDSYVVRHPNPFTLMTIEASEQWLAVTLKRLTDDLRGLVSPHVSKPRLAEYSGQFVSLFESVPFFVPDLVYLDGPDPEQVMGEIDGFRSTELHSLPMAADLLRIEPHLWPWTVIITDGRRGNARLLEGNLRRNWQVLHDPFGDHTIFRLDETPFGPVSEAHIAARLEAARAMRMKEAPVAS